jgi:sporulation protein YlmC with PRC-barrel domain
MQTCLLDHGGFGLSKESPKFVSSQRFAGMQVIDSKGSLVGTVKDVSVDFRNKNLAFHVATKARSEMDVLWDDVLSVEDVVLLKKEVELPFSTVAAPLPPPSVQAVVICPSCGTSAPGHAKFCPKCGAGLA